MSPQPSVSPSRPGMPAVMDHGHNNQEENGNKISMDLDRERQIAYEYLCHLEEAKNW